MREGQGTFTAGHPELIALGPQDLAGQGLLDHAYSAGRYHTLDYTAPLSTPLSAEDAAWAEMLVRGAGLV